LVFCSLKYNRNTIIIPLERQKSRHVSRGICVLSLWFFCDSFIHEGHSGISMLGNNYFIRKDVAASRSRVNGYYINVDEKGVIHCVWTAHADPTSGQTYLFVVSLNMLLCPISYKEAHVDVLWLVSCRRFFFFFIIFSLPEKVHICPFFL